MPERIGSLIALAIAGVLLGAAGAPGKHPPAVPAATSAGQSLFQLYSDAITTNPGLKAARAGLYAAEYGVHDAYFGYLPRITAVVNPQREYQHVLSTSNPVYQVGQKYFGNSGYSFQLLQPILDVAAAARIRGADAARRGQQSEYTATRQKLMYDVIEAYLLTLAALDNERLAATEQQTYANHVAEVRRRVARGLANSAELADIQAREDAATAERFAARAAIGKELARLQQLTGQQVQALLPLASNIPMGAPEPASPQAWIKTARDANPELKALAAQVDVANAEFGRMVGESLPRLDLVLSDERLAAGGSLYGGGALTDQQIAELRLTIPLFNANGRGYPEFAGYEKREQARYRREDRELDVESRVRTAFLDVTRDAQSARSLAQAEKNRGIVRKDVENRFHAGVASIGAVIDAERDYVRAQRQLLAAHYNYLIAMMQLKLLAGTIGVDDVRYINTLLDPRHVYAEQATPGAS